jgi:hypothetical protein
MARESGAVNLTQTSVVWRINQEFSSTRGGVSLNEAVLTQGAEGKFNTIWLTGTRNEKTQDAVDRHRQRTHCVTGCERVAVGAWCRRPRCMRQQSLDRGPLTSPCCWANASFSFLVYLAILMFLSSTSSFKRGRGSIFKHALAIGKS